MRAPGPGALVAVGDAFLLRPVHLDVGAVEVDGDRAGAQHRAPGGRKQPHHPAHDLPDAFLDTSQLRRAEPFGQIHRGRRGRRGHGRQRLPGRIGAAAVQPGPELRAEHLRLRHRDQILTCGQSPVPLLDRTDRVIQRGDRTQSPDHFGNGHHTRGRGQR